MHELQMLTTLIFNIPVKDDQQQGVISGQQGVISNIWRSYIMHYYYRGYDLPKYYFKFGGLFSVICQYLMFLYPNTMFPMFSYLHSIFF